MIKKLNKIAIINDDEVGTFLISRKIKKSFSNIEFFVFEDGESGFSFINNNRNNIENLPDLIFLDINMPIMNGWEFLENFEGIVRSIPKKIVIIIITNSINPEEKLKADLNPLVSEYWVTPIENENIDYLKEKYFNLAN